MKRLLIIVLILGIIFASQSTNAGTPECWEVLGTGYSGPCVEVKVVTNGVITGD